MNTRNRGITELLNSSDSEKIVRKGCRSSMAVPQQGNLCNDQQGASDAEEDEGPYRGDIPQLYIPDLVNTILSEAIKDSMMIGTTGREYMILTPRLKDYIGVETLKVKIPSGELEIPTNPPVNFITQCAQNPFQERLLIAA